MNALLAVEAVGLKIARADRHLTELGELVDAYYARRPIYLEGHFDEPTSQWITTIRITEEVPVQLGPVIGDVAHNLRSALDQLVWQLALLRTSEPYGRTQFAIFKQAQAYEDYGTRMLQSLAPEHAAFIERLQPYHDAEPTSTLLYGLNTLSNADKHREVHFANSALMGASLTVRMMGGGVGLGGLELVFGQFRDGSEVARIKDVVVAEDGEPPRFDVGIHGAFDLSVTDDDGNEISVYAGMFATREFVGDLVDWFTPLL